MPAKGTKRTAAAATAILILGVVGLAMMDDHPPKVPAPPSPPRRVSIRLLGPVSEIKGVTVPAHVLTAQRGSEFFQIDEPSVITVSLPGGKRISLPVKTAFVNTEVDIKTKSAVVVDINLLPLPKGVPYRESVAELRRLMREMGIEPDERMRKQMTTWPDDSGPVTYSAGMWISESVGLGGEVRSNPDGEWFVVFTFAAHANARQALWDPNFKATTKPAADEPKQ